MAVSAFVGMRARAIPIFAGNSSSFSLFFRIKADFVHARQHVLAIFHGAHCNL